MYQTTKKNLKLLKEERENKTLRLEAKPQSRKIFVTNISEGLISSACKELRSMRKIRKVHTQVVTGCGQFTGKSYNLLNMCKYVCCH